MIRCACTDMRRYRLHLLRKRDASCRHLEEELKIRGLDDEIKVVKTGCFGLCALGPVVIVYPDGHLLFARDAGGRPRDC